MARCRNNFPVDFDRWKSMTVAWGSLAHCQRCSIRPTSSRWICTHIMVCFFFQLFPQFGQQSRWIDPHVLGLAPQTGGIAIAEERFQRLHQRCQRLARTGFVRASCVRRSRADDRVDRSATATGLAANRRSSFPCRGYSRSLRWTTTNLVACCCPISQTPRL